jgi:hypothetical protein
MDTENHPHPAGRLDASKRPAWEYDELKHCGVDYQQGFMATYLCSKK